MTPKELTPKQEAFALGLASGLTQAEAYRQAFPRSRAWKDKTVWSRASTLASHGKVLERVEALRVKAMDANDITIERIARELAKIAFADPRRVMKWGEQGVVLLESSELTDDDAAIVSEVKQTTSMGGGSIHIKTHSKTDALRVLADWRGMFTRKVELTGKDGKDLVQTSGVLVVGPDITVEEWEARQAAKAQGGGA